MLLLLRFLRIFTFFQNPKSRDFLRFFCRVSYVFSNYACNVAIRGCGQSIEPVSKQILFIHDLLFIDHFSVSGDVRNHSVT